MKLFGFKIKIGWASPTQWIDKLNEIRHSTQVYIDKNNRSLHESIKYPQKKREA